MDSGNNRKANAGDEWIIMKMRLVQMHRGDETGFVSSTVCGYSSVRTKYLTGFDLV